MATFGDIVAYQYRADFYGPECILKVMESRDLTLVDPAVLTYNDTEAALTELANNVGLDREDERSFDSDNFPKVVLYDMIHDDSPAFCAGCGRRLNPESGSTPNLAFSDRASWIAKLWELIDLIDFNALALSESPNLENDVKTAMAWITEALGLPESQDT